MRKKNRFPIKIAHNSFISSITNWVQYASTFHQLENNSWNYRSRINFYSRQKKQYVERCHIFKFKAFVIKPINIWNQHLEQLWKMFPQSMSTCGWVNTGKWLLKLRLKWVIDILGATKYFDVNHETKIHLFLYIRPFTNGIPANGKMNSFEIPCSQLTPYHLWKKECHQFILCVISRSALRGAKASHHSGMVWVFRCGFSFQDPSMFILFIWPENDLSFYFFYLHHPIRVPSCCIQHRYKNRYLQ